MSIQARIKALAEDPAPDMVLPDPLYSRDYDDLKYVFNRAVEQAADAGRRFYGGFYSLTFKGAPHSALEVLSLLKTVEDLLTKWDRPATQSRVTWAMNDLSHRGKPMSADELRADLVSVRGFLLTWKPLAEKMKAASARVIKGRKPSTKPRVTPARTTENTGTCACCGANVKLASGKIVMHGYTIRPGWRVGRCFGVGYSPIETGKDGLEAYLLALRSRVSDLERSIAESEKRDPNEELQRTPQQPFRTVGIRLANLRSELRFTNSDINTTVTRIRDWVPRPLPT